MFEGCLSRKLIKGEGKLRVLHRQDGEQLRGKIDGKGKAKIVSAKAMTFPYGDYKMANDPTESRGV